MLVGLIRTRFGFFEVSKSRCETEASSSLYNVVSYSVVPERSLDR